MDVLETYSITTSLTQEQNRRSVNNHWQANHNEPFSSGITWTIRHRDIKFVGMIVSTLMSILGWNLAFAWSAQNYRKETKYCWDSGSLAGHVSKLDLPFLDSLPNPWMPWNQKRRGLQKKEHPWREQRGNPQKGEEDQRIGQQNCTQTTSVPSSALRTPPKRAWPKQFTLPWEGLETLSRQKLDNNAPWRFFQG